MPENPPYAAFIPAGDDDISGLVGPIEGWWVSFTWPVARIRRVGTHYLDVNLGKGFKVRIARWKPIDTVAMTKMTEMFHALRLALQRPQSSGVIESRAILMSLFSTYADLPEDTGSLGNRALARFTKLLSGQACKDAALKNFADQAGLSTDYARKLFRRHSGTSPLTYRTNVRMAQARDLLANSTLSVKEVAHKSGYPDPRYFSRVFRNHFGVSPREMIRKYRLDQ
jgi:AraC-like DNA-binding protein